MSEKYNNMSFVFYDCKFSEEKVLLTHNNEGAVVTNCPKLKTMSVVPKERGVERHEYLEKRGYGTGGTFAFCSVRASRVGCSSVTEYADKHGELPHYDDINCVAKRFR